MKRHLLNVAACLVLLACLGSLVILSGCRTSGNMGSVQKSSVCPLCNMATTTASIKDVTYTKGVCPYCQTVTPIDPILNESLRNYVGFSVGDTVHVCDHCKSIVETCPVCRKKMGVN